MAHHYDVVVLGAGPGGYVAAIRAAQLGLNTAVVEPKYWGGVCLNVGCIPSKALLRNAELAHIFTREAKQFGISGDATFDYGVAFDRSRKVAEGRVAGVHFLMKKNKITEIHGYGTFKDDHTLEVDLNEGDTETVTFDNIIIATGSSTKLVPGTSLSDNVVTYEKLIMTRELPSSIVIAGAGAIGMEFGYVMKNYGVDVTIVEFLPRALPNEDAEVSKEIENQFKKLGVKVLTGTKVESIKDDGDGVTVTVSKDGKSEEIKTEKVLQAIGFAPNIEGYGLDRAGGQATDRKAIGIDDYMRTNVPHIYAIGDVTGLLQLAHVAEAQGVVASETIGGADTLPLGDYRMLPRATFCQPQVASFGLTEEQARDEGYDVKVAKFPFTANAKAHGVGDPSGFVKLIADGKYGELIGGHLIGHDVSELLPELMLAQKWDLTATPDDVRSAAGMLPRTHRAHDQLLIHLREQASLYSRDQVGFQGMRRRWWKTKSPNALSRPRWHRHWLGVHRCGSSIRTARRPRLTAKPPANRRRPAASAVGSGAAGARRQP